MRWWQASPISRPPPRDRPLIAATTGLPIVSSLRSVAFIRSTFSKIAGASAGTACVMSLRSPPAKKVFFAEETTTPTMASDSAAMSSAKRSTARSIESPYASFIVLALWFGSSRIRLTMPSSPRSYRTASVVASVISVCLHQDPWGMGSDALDDSGNAHAAADAKGGNAVLLVAALQFVDQRAEDHRTGRTERVAHGDRAAVDVDLVMRHIHVAHETHDDRGEGLVHLEQVDVACLKAGLGQRLARGRCGTGQHDGRVGARDGNRQYAGSRGQPVALAGFFAANSDEGCAIDDARRVAGVVDVVDLFDAVSYTHLRAHETVLD